MNRRKMVIGSAVLAAARTPSAIAQATSARRVAIFTPYAADDREMADRIAAFRRTLGDLGWTDGDRVTLRQVQAPEAPEVLNSAAAELLAWRPDVVLSATTLVTAELAKQTRQIPIVFVNVSDPVRSRLVESLAKPGGNVTGFVNIDPTLGGKWAELLHELVPGLQHAGVMYNPATAPYASSYTERFRTVARGLSIEASDVPVRNEGELASVMESLAGRPSGGLVVISDSFTTAHRSTIRIDAERLRLPVVWPHPFMAREGGLVAYGLTTTDLYVRAAQYVDRVLRGETPSQLPVQQPNTYEFVINMKAAKALGLTIPLSILARADEVIE